jgi:cell division septal protein FtsQ
MRKKPKRVKNKKLKSRSQSRIFGTRRRKGYSLNAKTASKKRRKGNKKTDSPHVLAMATVGIFIVVLGLAGWKVWDYVRNSPVFKIAEIQVSGVETFSEGEIIELSGLEQGMNFFDVNIRKVKKNIEKNPPIKEAVVKKDFGIVNIEVHERQPLATIKSGGKRYFLDETGVLFFLNEETDIKTLPKITGVKLKDIGAGDKCDDPMLKKALTVLRLYKDNGIKRLFSIGSVEIRNTDNVVLWTGPEGKLRKGTKILLGNKNYEQKMADLGAILESGRRVNSEIDLSGKKNSVY